MIDIKTETKVGTKTVQLLKWHQGALKDYMVYIYDENNHKIFDKDDMWISEARKLFKEKVKELEETE